MKVIFSISCIKLKCSDRVSVYFKNITGNIALNNFSLVHILNTVCAKAQTFKSRMLMLFEICLRSWLARRENGSSYFGCC